MSSSSPCEKIENANKSICLHNTHQHIERHVRSPHSPLETIRGSQLDEPPGVCGNLQNK